MIFFPSDAILRDCVRETPDQRGDAETREAGDRVDEDERERVEEERKEEEEEEEIILAGEGGAAESAGDRRRRRGAAAEAEAEANGRRANAEENRSAFIVGRHTPDRTTGRDEEQRVSEEYRRLDGGRSGVAGGGGLGRRGEQQTMKRRKSAVIRGRGILLYGCN